MEAAASVCGIQAQDVRAAGLALRSRVPGLSRAAVDAADLVRTWTVRGTVHLIAAGDRPWFHALCAPRFERRFAALIEKRGGLDIARRAAGDVVDVLAPEPLARADLLTALARRGHPNLDPYAVNVFVPWLAQLGVVVGLPDGRLRAAEPPPAVDEDEALQTIARRYLAGYGPATAHDLAWWSGLPLGLAHRGLDAASPLESAGDLVALPGTLAVDPPPPPAACLLAGFDTLLLGWRRRELWLSPDEDHRVLRGGGIVRPAVLVDGAVTGTWALRGSGRVRTIEVEWFGPRADAQALEAEARDVGRFLGVETRIAD